MTRPAFSNPTWTYELALRVKYDYGPDEFERILARADQPEPGWNPACDRDYLCASLAHEVLARLDG